MTDSLIDDDVILVRTLAGQDAVFDDADLDVPQRRLLRLVNGYTPLGELMVRLDPADDWPAAARGLLAARLIRVRGRANDGEAPPFVSTRGATLAG